MKWMSLILLDLALAELEGHDLGSLAGLESPDLDQDSLA